MSDFDPELVPPGSCEYDAGSGPMATDIFMSMSEVGKVTPDDLDALNAMHVEETEVMGNEIGDNNGEGGIGEWELIRDCPIADRIADHDELETSTLDRAIQSLPDLMLALQGCALVKKENSQLRAEVRRLNNGDEYHQPPPNSAETELQDQVAILKTRLDKAMFLIKALRKTHMASTRSPSASIRSPSASIRSPPARPQALHHGTIADAAKRIEASNRRITSLAIALTEGGDAIEIAGQLLDEVDSAGGTGEEDAAGDDHDSLLRMTVSRIAALEYQMDDFMTIVRSTPGG